jgi:hypothetical protein
MNLTPLRRLATQVLVVAVGLAAVLTSGAPAQSLGDVAKQEDARRKSAAAAGKVYTNDDLKGAPAPASSPAAPAPSTSAPGGAAPVAPPAADGAKAADGDAKAAAGAPTSKDDEAAWRKKRQDTQEALDRAKVLAEALQSRINGLTADFAARDDPAQRAKVARDRQTALTELERVTKEVDQRTKELANLVEEARKAGVPAGWVR